MSFLLEAVGVKGCSLATRATWNLCHAAQPLRMGAVKTTLGAVTASSKATFATTVTSAAAPTTAKDTNVVTVYKPTPGSKWELLDPPNTKPDTINTEGWKPTRDQLQYGTTAKEVDVFLSKVGIGFVPFNQVHPTGNLQAVKKLS